ncbi:O-linked N-acetylglucosamine transferase, SPINDLY family protein [[Phormidium] sp. ETS-05]|uniref:O-linked N-acetylglucosamine transferase, SPINDLY family protein n=1 Tax=[Phormidium] sp. ETS-05 TaxID=222819 RepID=UPI0018EF13A5|nr:O-linked N-acetylglucosamine transferase, SPINDLY family protein [[Phormidium] sp. ETS-05]
MTADLGEPTYSWQEQAREYLLTADYSRAAILYEKAIETEPDVKSYYWHLGLMLLLQGKEEEATTTWLVAMVEGEPEQVELWTPELVEILQTEARRREDLQDNAVAWLIRGHIREIQPTNADNLLKLMRLALGLDRFSGSELTDWGVIELLHEQPPGTINPDELLQVLKQLLTDNPLHPEAIHFAAACWFHLKEHSSFVKVILPLALDIGYGLLKQRIAAALLELCWQADDSNTEVLLHLASFYQNGVNYAGGIELAKEYYNRVKTWPDKIYANHFLLRGLMSAGGYWEEACRTLEKQESLLRALTVKELHKLPPGMMSRLLTSAYFFAYFRDRARENREIINKLSASCQTYFKSQAAATVESYSQGFGRRQNLDITTRRLKIGYISHCLRSHSVGWLARWLLQYHDRQRFEIHAYMIMYKDTGDPLQAWYVSQVEYCHQLGVDAVSIAAQIYEDEIDILIDLDSLTGADTCEVIFLKPAPIQVTWLGWDASGLPAIDYFIADPYVLPQTAQDYYIEKIWRLPHTYIAVDGFEVGVPTRRRQDLNIPRDAVVYYSGQRGYKRHYDTARLQMRILKEVPNSYLAIKGFAEQASMINFFTEIAELEGVNPNRLRFLPIEPEEAVHRANLGIADVVLDTYPYNGATTTLETLWMGIPLVTRVGEQFAARNSYTMMMNVGVTEGIAWSDAEYVEWGVRLGKSPELRRQISWKLYQSRQFSPLWDGQQFAREMEMAYTQMWQNYINGVKSI